MNQSICPTFNRNFVENEKNASATQIAGYIFLFYLLNSPIILLGVIIFIINKLKFRKT